MRGTQQIKATSTKSAFRAAFNCAVTRLCSITNCCSVWFSFHSRLARKPTIASNHCIVEPMLGNGQFSRPLFRGCLRMCSLRHKHDTTRTIRKPCLCLPLCKAVCGRDQLCCPLPFTCPVAATPSIDPWTTTCVRRFDRSQRWKMKAAHGVCTSLRRRSMSAHSWTCAQASGTFQASSSCPKCVGSLACRGTAPTKRIVIEKKQGEQWGGQTTARGCTEYSIRYGLNGRVSAQVR